MVSVWGGVKSYRANLVNSFLCFNYILFCRDEFAGFPSIQEYLRNPRRIYSEKYQGRLILVSFYEKLDVAIRRNISCLICY